MLCSVCCCVEVVLRLRLCSVVPWASTVLCFVPLRVCPKVCKLCNLALVLFSKGKEMSIIVSCHHLAASVLG